MLASTRRGDVRPQRQKGAPSTSRGDARPQRPKGAPSTSGGDVRPQRPKGAPPEKQPPDQQPLSSTSVGDARIQRPKGAPPDPPPPVWRSSARTRSGRGGKGSRRRREARLAAQKALRGREAGAAVGSAAVTCPQSERADIPAGGDVTCTFHDFAGKGWLTVTAQSTAGMLAMLGALACPSTAPTSPTGHALLRVPKTFTCRQCQLVVATPERVAARMVADGWPLPKTCGACKRERTRRWAVRRLQTWSRRHLLQRRLHTKACTAAAASGGDHRGSHGGGVGCGTPGGPPGGGGRGDDGGAWKGEEPDGYPSSSGDDARGGGGEGAGWGTVGDALPRCRSSGAPPVAADPAEGLAATGGEAVTVAQGAGRAAGPALSSAPPAATEPAEASAATGGKAEPAAWGAGGPGGTPHTPAPAAAAMTETAEPTARGAGGPGGGTHTSAPAAAAARTAVAQGAGRIQAADSTAAALPRIIAQMKVHSPGALGDMVYNGVLTGPWARWMFPAELAGREELAASVLEAAPYSWEAAIECLAEMVHARGLPFTVPEPSDRRRIWSFVVSWEKLKCTPPWLREGLRLIGGGQRRTGWWAACRIETWWRDIAPAAAPGTAAKKGKGRRRTNAPARASAVNQGAHS